MAPGPTDLEAWTALQAFTTELDQVRRPKELKEAMHQFVSQSWDMSESKLDFVDFGVVWFDDHYRRICNKFSKIGPGRETFSMATYRTLKTSRLDGYWDVMLDNLADWIKSFTGAFRQHLTLNDYDKIIACMPRSRNLKTYEQNVKELFWVGDRRSMDFMTQFPPPAYQDAYNKILQKPPQDDWNLRLIMSQIHDKGLMCKSVMLHVGFWFNPYLEEPANRANVKPPMFHHLKPAFSAYNPYDLRYVEDEDWIAPALSLQRVVLNYALEWFPKSNAIVGNLGMLRDMSQNRYSDYVNTVFWNRLIREVRIHTNIPFQHISLVKFKTVDDVPQDTAGVMGEDKVASLRSQVNNIIQEEYSDRQSLDTEDERENFKKEGSNSAVHTGSRESVGNALPASTTPEAPAAESDGEQDILHVRTPSPASSNPLKKRKVQHSDEGSSHPPAPAPAPVNDNQYVVPRVSARKMVTLQVPSQNGTAMQLDGDGQSAQVLRTRPLMPAVLPSQDIHINREHLGNGTHPLAQPSQWNHIEQETAQRALAHYEGNLRLKNVRLPSPERRQSMPTLQTYPPPKNNLAMATSQSTPSPRPPIPPSIPQPTPQPVMMAQTLMAPSPALARNKTEQAIAVLQNEYEDRMQVDEMLAVIHFFKNDFEAGIFLTLKPGPLRDAWLRDGMKQKSLI